MKFDLVEFIDQHLNVFFVLVILLLITFPTVIGVFLFEQPKEEYFTIDGVECIKVSKGTFCKVEVRK